MLIHMLPFVCYSLILSKVINYVKEPLRKFMCLFTDHSSWEGFTTSLGAVARLDIVVEDECVNLQGSSAQSKEACG